jgi:hypothetical protein
MQYLTVAYERAVARTGLSPVSECALPGAHEKGAGLARASTT